MPLLDAIKAEWDVVKDVKSKEPLYHRLYSLLKTFITNGTAEFGSQMPTEQQLSIVFDVSRITVKRAMGDLADENLIDRRRGRGSHVIYHYQPEPVKAPLVEMLENLATMSKHSTVKVISIEKLISPATVREALNLGSNGKAIKVVRVRSNEYGNPYAYYVSWTLPQRSGFTKGNIEKKTRLSILKENGVRITRVEQTLGAENAGFDVAAQLGIPVDTAL
ncbi:MAG: GntR family transcriptional regulator, partial [Candidatus Azotimanducaceae bacterium]